MNTLELLDATYPSMLIIEERDQRDIVIGAPHHAPAGVARLPCDEHQASDENTGHLAYHLAEQLGCASIIACNYTIDGNKYAGSDYAKQIASWAPKVLVEIHAHSGGGTPMPKDVEISCGDAAKNELSVNFGLKLAEALSESRELASVTVNGDFTQIPKRLRATQTATIKDSKWLGFHLEISPKLRIRRTMIGRPPAIGYAFCAHLARVLRTVASGESERQKGLTTKS